MCRLTPHHITTTNSQPPTPTHQVIPIAAPITLRLLLRLLLVQLLGQPGHLVAALHLAEVQDVGAELLCLCLEVWMYVVKYVSCHDHGIRCMEMANPNLNSIDQTP